VPEEDYQQMVSAIEQRDMFHYWAEKFHYWAEELASHGFNTTIANGGEKGQAHKSFAPLVREYWDSMYEERMEITGTEPEVTEEDEQMVYTHFVHGPSIVNYMARKGISFDIVHQIAHKIEEHFPEYKPYIHLTHDPECGGVELWIFIMTDLHPREARPILAEFDKWWIGENNMNQDGARDIHVDLGYGEPREYYVKRAKEEK
jgi:hypothetical protein